MEYKQRLGDLWHYKVSNYFGQALKEADPARLRRHVGRYIRDGELCRDNAAGALLGAG